MAGKSQIKSNEAEWDQLKEIKGEMKASISQLNGLGEAYTAKSNSLGDAISKSHYRILEKSQFSKQIKENISALNNSLVDINGQFIVFNEKVQNAYKNGQINLIPGPDCCICIAVSVDNHIGHIFLPYVHLAIWP